MFKDSTLSSSSLSSSSPAPQSHPLPAPDLLPDPPPPPPATGCCHPPSSPHHPHHHHHPSTPPHPQDTGACGVCQDRCVSPLLPLSPLPLHVQPLPLPTPPTVQKAEKSVCEEQQHHHPHHQPRPHRPAQPPQLSLPDSRRCSQARRHRGSGGGGGGGRGVAVVVRPMKKLLSWVKAVVFGARERLLLTSRCSGSGLRRQFGFQTLRESPSSDLVDSASSSAVLDGDRVSDVVVVVDHDGDDDDDVDDDDDDEGDRTDSGDRNVFPQLGESGGEKDRLVTKEDPDREEEEEGASRGAGSSAVRVLRTCRRRMSRVTVVSFLWSLLSLIVAGACAFSFYQPSWVSHPDHLHSFGLFTHCVRDPGLFSPSSSSSSSSSSYPYPRAVCQGYGPEGRVDLGSVPAGAWQASTLLFGGGVCLQVLGALVSLVLLLLPSHPYSGRRVALLCGYLQTLAVLLLLSGLVMFPLGFSTHFFRYYCGEGAGVFSLGHCRLGWSYVLAMTATALAVFCPVLSNYTDLPLRTAGGEDWEKGEAVEEEGRRRAEKEREKKEREEKEVKKEEKKNEKRREGDGDFVTIV